MRLPPAVIKEAVTSAGVLWPVLGKSLGIGVFLWLVGGAGAQNIVVDAAPSRAVNSFSPFRALGGAIDRLRGGITRKENEKHTERMLTGPVLKELLGATRQRQTLQEGQTVRLRA